MVLKASEETTTFYEFDEKVLESYKNWLNQKELSPSRCSFVEFICDEENLGDFVVDEGYSGIFEFENFNEWINQ